MHKYVTFKEALFISGTHINIGGLMGHCRDSAYQLSPGSSGRNPSLHKPTLEHMITTHLGDRTWTHSLANICVQLCLIMNSHWVFSEVTFLTSLAHYSLEFSFLTQHHPNLTQSFHLCEEEACKLLVSISSQRYMSGKMCSLLGLQKANIDRLKNF